MSLLPEEASFEELVQECFLAHRGAGLMLSPLDLELIADWGSHQVPFEIIARGIRRAAERALFDARPDEPAMRSLRACRKDVDAEIKKYLARSAGAARPASAEAEAPSDGAAPAVVALGFDEARAKKARAALKKLAKARPELAAAVAGPCEALLSREALPPELDERLETALLRGLPFAERLPLLRQSRELLAAANVSSARAKRLARRFHRGAVVRRHLGVPGFW